MKYATRMLVLALTMLPLLASAQLNSSQRIVAQVPFEFAVGSKIVPAGEWVVQPATMDGRVLVIRNTEASAGVFSTSSLVESKKPSEKCTLIFHRYGNSYFLDWSETRRCSCGLSAAAEQGGGRDARTKRVRCRRDFGRLFEVAQVAEGWKGTIPGEGPYLSDS